LKIDIKKMAIPINFNFPFIMATAISYSNNREESGLLEGGNTMAETTNNKIIYED
jgi:hypothetical protein